MAEVQGSLREPVVVYVELPPWLATPASQALVSVGLPIGSRILVEKPFGHDLASARRLNRLDLLSTSGSAKTALRTMTSSKSPPSERYIALGGFRDVFISLACGGEGGGVCVL